MLSRQARKACFSFFSSAQSVVAVQGRKNQVRAREREGQTGEGERGRCREICGRSYQATDEGKAAGFDRKRSKPREWVGVRARESER